MREGDRARVAAANVIGRVLRSGAYSNVLVESETAGAATPVRAKAKALVFGALRRIEQIDLAIATSARRPLEKFDTEVLDRLRVSAFEILYGELPTPIAVSSGVDLIRSTRPRASGLANAILRGVASFEVPADTGLRLPDWLVEDLDRNWGAESRHRFQIASIEDPGRVMRIRHPDRFDGEWHGGITGAALAKPGKLPEEVVIQDGASIQVGNVVGAEAAMTVLDLAAAPGGKTLHLLDQTGPEGLVLAMDRHPRRARDAAKRVPDAKWLIGDGRQLPFPPGRFDRVLLDAPCTGLGTLRRRPEIRLRVDPDSVRHAAALQVRLLEAALEVVAPGGSLVYSVCTVTSAETIDVVDGFPMRPPDGPGEPWGKGRLLAPHLTGTDGMFISVFDA